LLVPFIKEAEITDFRSKNVVILSTFLNKKRLKWPSYQEYVNNLEFGSQTYI